PIKGVGDEEVADLMPAIIEYTRSPLGMAAFTGILVRVQRSTVEKVQSMQIGWEMRRHPVQNHSQSGLMAFVHEGLELRRGAEALGGGVITEHLVSPGLVQ